MTQVTACAGTTATGPPLLEWGISLLTHAGERESGDRHLVAGFDRGMLLAVVDGCGHGREAAAAARIAVATLESNPGEDVVELMRRCHERLRETRGAVIGLAAFHGRENILTWLGVGNIEARLWQGANQAAGPLLMRNGVVGYRLPPLQALARTVGPGDLLVMTTDGIRGDFADKLDVSGKAAQIAAGIAASHAKGTDDGLVLVARYLGWPA